MENRLIAMAETLDSMKQFTELNADHVFDCLNQIITETDSSLWSLLRSKISQQLQVVLHQEIIDLMEGVEGEWKIAIDTESSYDDAGGYYQYPTDPTLNGDDFPVSLSGDENDYVDYEEEWLPKYPTLTTERLEKLVYKLEMLYDEMNQAYMVTEDMLGGR